jgi:HD superfamily phosphohydrolase
MYDIVANKTNSLDVDKIDYLQRDSSSLGLKSVGFKQDRIIQSSRVINNTLCYNAKIYGEIEQVFMTRYKLFKECYSHRVCRAIDYMIVDALMEANPVFHFEEMIRNPASYVDVSDNILGHIETSRDPALAKSKEILKKIRQRELYRFLSQKILTNK